MTEESEDLAVTGILVEKKTGDLPATRVEEEKSSSKISHLEVQADIPTDRSA